MKNPQSNAADLKKPVETESASQATSPMLFAALVFGLPLLIIVLLAALDVV